MVIFPWSFIKHDISFLPSQIPFPLRSRALTDVNLISSLTLAAFNLPRGGLCKATDYPTVLSAPSLVGLGIVRVFRLTRASALNINLMKKVHKIIIH